jgi:RimJ/RimL family protein N-acetyltransferase
VQRLSRRLGESGAVEYLQAYARKPEAMAALVGYLLDVLGADLVRAYADAENVPSIRVAEKVGIHLEERFRRRYGDEVWYGVRYERRRDDPAEA